MEIIISITSLFISLVAAVFSYYSFRKTQSASIMPVLVFSRRTETVWQIENVGQGPALSVAIGDKEQSGKWKWKVRCYPIAAGGSIEVPWPNQGDELIATYTDVKGKAYSTFCSMSENHLYEENKFPDLKPTIDEWNLKAMREEYRRMF